MVTIRLSRGGSKKRPFYSILVADQRRALRGRFIERVGFYNPLAAGQEEKLRIDTARIDHWVGRGAQPSERVTQLYKQATESAQADASDAPDKSDKPEKSDTPNKSEKSEKPDTPEVSA